MGRLIHEALSAHILGAAMTVLNELMPGLDEKLYENALVDKDDYPCYLCHPWSKNLSNICDGRYLSNNKKGEKASKWRNPECQRVSG